MKCDCPRCPCGTGHKTCECPSPYYERPKCEREMHIKWLEGRLTAAERELAELRALINKEKTP